MRHITIMALTASLGLMAVFCVDFVDMIFISMLGKTELVAAIGYAGAIGFFTSSFGIGMAIAAGALVARALGSNEYDLAKKRSTTSLLYGIIFSGMFAALVWFLIPRLLSFMGASGETLRQATNYLQIIIPSLPLLLIGMVGGAILRSHGDARRAMMPTIAGAIINGILDPILIFGLELELSGAAYATVVARMAMATVAVFPIFRFYGGLIRPTLLDMKTDIKPILMIAFPAVLTQLATPIGQAYVIKSMAVYGEAAVAAMAIISRLTPISFGVIFALSGAIGPIIGQNYGAGKHLRVKRAFFDGIIFTAVVVVVISALLFSLRPALSSLFGLNGESESLVFLFAGPLSLAFFFNGLVFVSNASFNNLGYPFYSTLVNWGRHTLGTIPLVILFSVWFGAPGVLIGQAAGGIIFGIISFIMAYKIISSEKSYGNKIPSGIKT